MDISPIDFRDKSLEKVAINYDWELGRNYVLLSVRDRYGVVSKFKLNAVSECYINEDFGCAHISHCKLVKVESGLFLSLDPYDECEEMQVEDNFCFTFKSIERID